MPLVSDRFERIVAEETGKVRTEIAGLDAKLSDLRAELKGDIANLHGQIANLHGLIPAQAKWIVVTFLGVAAFISVVLPFMWKLADKLVR